MQATELYQTKSGVYAYSNAVCGDSNPCFGPAVVNRQTGSTYLFEDASETEGLISGYFQNYRTGTSYSAALASLLKYLPPDTRVGRLVVDAHLSTLGQKGKCGLLTLTSARIQRDFAKTTSPDPGGIIGVEFTSVDTNSRISFNRHDIESANLSLGSPGWYGRCL